MAAQERIRFGVTPIQTGVGFERIRRIVLAAEALGYESVWLNDHFFTSTYFYPLPPPSAPYYECWTTLASLAAITKTIRLGTLCANVGFRSPALLAKMAACLDVISGGRLELGLGAGWFREEHTAYGFPFPNTAERAQMLEEAVRIIRGMWQEEKFSFRGRHYAVEEAYCSPKPVQTPHPPIGIGARGSRIMLRVVAGCADHWNIQTPLTPKQYKRKVEFLERHCQDLQRDPETISRSIWAGVIIAEDERDFADVVRRLNPPHPAYLESRIAGVPERCIEIVQEYVNLGVSLFVLYFTVDELRSLEIFAQRVIPAFR
jgi:F420-dependent oxidoreductase-like protein